MCRLVAHRNKPDASRVSQGPASRVVPHPHRFAASSREVRQQPAPPSWHPAVSHPRFVVRTPPAARVKRGWISTCGDSDPCKQLAGCCDSLKTCDTVAQVTCMTDILSRDPRIVGSPGASRALLTRRVGSAREHYLPRLRAVCPRPNLSPDAPENNAVLQAGTTHERSKSVRRATMRSIVDRPLGWWCYGCKRFRPHRPAVRYLPLASCCAPGQWTGVGGRPRAPQRIRDIRATWY